MGNCQDSEVIIVTEEEHARKEEIELTRARKRIEEDEKRENRRIKILEQDDVKRALTSMRRRDELAQARRVEQANRISKITGKQIDPKELATNHREEKYDSTATYDTRSWNTRASNHYTGNHNNYRRGNHSGGNTATNHHYASSTSGGGNGMFNTVAAVAIGASLM